jgi:spore maturation protein CgeB
MRVVIFGHSLVSDWNHGNAHFLRGVCRELLARGDDVRVLEPRDGWSRANLVAAHGTAPEAEFDSAFPELSSETYELDGLDLDGALDGADLVLVHEWSEPALVSRVGSHRAAARDYRLLFWDTHHRAATRPHEMVRFELDHYDGVLAFGEAIRRIYLERAWAERAWTWHEAADVRLFRPHEAETVGDLVWIGNWGDGERSRELRERLLRPARRAGLRGSIYGVRYPWHARLQVRLSGLTYRGWLPNHRVPDAFARHRLTVHVPRRPYVEALPGIPTIRVFEALACGIPLISTPWEDVEGLFRPRTDFLVARDGGEIEEAMRAVLADPTLASDLRRSGLETIRARHTCAHRVAELDAILAELERDAASGRPMAGEAR